MQVTWHNLEHLIANLIVTVDRRLRRGGGLRGAFLLVGESFLKKFNLSRYYEEL